MGSQAVLDGVAGCLRWGRRLSQMGSQAVLDGVAGCLRWGRRLS